MNDELPTHFTNYTNYNDILVNMGNITNNIYIQSMVTISNNTPNLNSLIIDLEKIPIGVT